jgi:hypothetical protein
MEPQKTICPKCHTEQDATNECVKCGIIVSKYNEIQTRRYENHPGKANMFHVPLGPKLSHKAVSWSEAFVFWFSVFWRSIITYLAVFAMIGTPLAALMPNEHPAAVTIIATILVFVVFWFAMAIPIKIVLKKNIDKLLSEKMK